MISQKKKIKDFPSVLSVADIQEILGIGRRQAYELVNSGQFHVARAGRRIMVSKSIFMAWLKGSTS
ncbi:MULTISPECIES: helix-turn-helix domain-containing protein [Brevibacillus]|uniref:helix-turn-helix domain-containing protein n=1 Tax=Brevibacillus TaxID=55080 RepID=UPI000D1008D5|nr:MULTISPECIES: helix-turn-helix domain-containing protein [Brevibacillus]MED1947200.1 helix-turn-helix domain-containing protein [Brevibacillus formosus]MED1997533.1 helix-turn-helix domain-containing protein [Brevibacillus formosus]MED2083390.1 helix-turn-helix domain-containing protein [Brevibacillus formosus]PSK16792.1 DNA-binding protein [Brevibacillus sp. NRRL NRS-603]